MKVTAPDYGRKVQAPSSHTGDFGWQQTSRPPEPFSLTVSQDEVSAEYEVPFQLRRTVPGGPNYHTMVYALRLACVQWPWLVDQHNYNDASVAQYRRPYVVAANGGVCKGLPCHTPGGHFLIPPHQRSHGA